MKSNITIVEKLIQVTVCMLRNKIVVFFYFSPILSYIRGCYPSLQRPLIGPPHSTLKYTRQIRRIIFRIPDVNYLLDAH